MLWHQTLTYYLECIYVLFRTCICLMHVTLQPPRPLRQLAYLYMTLFLFTLCKKWISVSKCPSPDPPSLHPNPPFLSIPLTFPLLPKSPPFLHAPPHPPCFLPYSETELSNLWGRYRLNTVFSGSYGASQRFKHLIIV